MTAFSYEAVDAAGTLQTGFVSADSQTLVASKLKAQGLIVVSVTPVTNEADTSQLPFWHRPIYTRAAFSLQERSVLVRQLASLTSSGLSLERSLTALRDDSANKRQQHILSAILADVSAGSSFGKALEDFKHEFPAMDRAVIGAGEQGANLAVVLEQLAVELEQHQLLKSKLISAALYPAVVSVAALAIMLFLLGSVVPQVAEVFQSSKHALPTLTRLMLSLSRFIQDWGSAVGVLLAGAAFGLRLALNRYAQLRSLWDRGWLYIPIIGRLVRGYNGARFAATLSLLVAAGIPIMKALQAAADTLSNAAMRADAVSAIDDLRQGAPLAASLSRGGKFPPLLILFLRLGERSGDLPNMLQRASKQISDDVQRRALNLATVLEPLLIVAMGGIVLVIVLAVLTPIMELNQFVKL